ncbi:MAG: glycosyl hydrolase family 28-related protein, partial [Pirellula sp.]
MDNHCIRFYKATIAVSALFVSLTVCDLCWALETQYGARLDLESDVKYPLTPMIIDVTKPPYNATGDGIQDDTAAIQRALTDMMGTHKMLYFPNGIYLVSRTLQWSKKNSAGRDAWGKNFLCGQNGNKTVIRLKEGTFTDPQKPASIMWCGGFGSADWFHNYVENVTFDVGDNNAGAIGLQFYSNNSGAVRNCRFLAGQESGLIGLDLGHRDMNGPLLVRNCEVIGFDRGISTSRAVNGQTFEYITLRDQRQFGFDNEGQAISVRGLLSENNVPVVRSYGVFCLVDAQLKGKREASNWPAIINYNGGRIFLRDVTTSRYKRAVGDVETPDWFASVRVQGDDKPGSLG